MYQYKKIKLKWGSTIDEHRLITKVEGFDNVVHHKDGNKRNNDPSNLEVMTRCEHAKKHGLGTDIRPTEIFAPDKNGKAICKHCNTSKPWEMFVTNKTWKNGKMSICKSCRSAYVKRLRTGS